jgi:branched-chain amino acid transport system permease protein
MTLLLQLLLGGLSLGAVYGLLALGFVVVFRSSGVVDFAHPAFLMIGTYVIARVGIGGRLPFAVALLAGVLAAGLVALAVQRFLVLPMAGRSLIAISIMTLGVDTIAQTEIIRRIGVDGYLPVADPWGDRVVRLGGLVFPQSRIAALVVAGVIIAAFLAWLRYSVWGVAMRAVADDPQTAALMGIRRTTVSALAWTLAGMLAAVAGLFLTTFPSPGLQPVSAAAALRAFPAAIIGGLDSIGGAIVGGLIVGIAESLVQGYAGDLDLLGHGAQGVMPYVVMLAVLLVRPSGLFGTPELHRV